jgi:hypothetical protein
MEDKFELQFEDNEYYLVNGNTNDTVATTDKVLLKEYDGYMKKLSNENCDEIFGVVDLRKLSMDQYPIGRELHSEQEAVVRIAAFETGFNKAMDLNKDKLFTVEDMRRAIYLSWDDSSLASTDIIESLKQPKEIEVEIEQVLIQSSIEGEAIWEYRLDENGCLILRRI